jgi:hypothetical protein
LIVGAETTMLKDAFEVGVAKPVGGETETMLVPALTGVSVVVAWVTPV